MALFRKSKSTKELIYRLDAEGFILCYDNGVGINNESELSYKIKSVLANKNFIYSTEGEYLIPYDQIYDFYYQDSKNDIFENNLMEREFIDDYKAFQFPELFRGYIKFENRGNYSIDKEVIYDYSFWKDGKQLEWNKLSGNVLTSGRISFLLPKEIYEIVKIVKNFNTNSEKRISLYEQYSLLTKLKEELNHVPMTLNRRLRTIEQPLLIDEIKLGMKEIGDGFFIAPKVYADEERQEQFEKTFSSQGANNAYIIKNKRVVFKNENTLNQIHEDCNVSIEDMHKILNEEHKLNYVEGIDMEDIFSPRVKGIGYLSLGKLISSSKGEENWFDSNDYLPIYRDDVGEEIQFTPDDVQHLEEALTQEGNILKIKNDYTDKIILAGREQIEDIVDRIKSAEVKVQDIKSLTLLEAFETEVINNSTNSYFEIAGKYVNKHDDIISEIKEQKQLLETDDKDSKENKNKRIGLLIYDNQEVKEYEEVSDEDKYIEDYRPSIFIKKELFKHQKAGVAKMMSLYNKNERNGILLADDMGLGKTLQIITLMALIIEQDKSARFLIVAPKMLLQNWKDEISNFVVEEVFKEKVIQGRIANTIEEERIKLKDIAQYNLVITTYETLYINHILFGKNEWAVMVCDEIQKAKNSKTQIGYAIKTQNALFKVACTATPIENSTEDLWNILDFCKPGLLGTQNEFKKSLKNNSTNDVLNKQQIEYDIANKLDNYVIRRNKDIIKNKLPNKKIILQKIKASNFERKCIKEVLDKRLEGESPLVLVNQLISICAHPLLYKKEIVSSIDKIINSSSKMIYLKAVLNEIKNKDEKVLIFADWYKIQEFIINACQKWFGITPLIINGKTTEGKRQSSLDLFKKSIGFDVIILSTEVAGVGLTITEANNVIHYLRKWNPAKENQATDRVYRIGQLRDVNVYIPVITYNEEGKETYNDMESYIEKYINLPTKGLSPDEKLNALLVKKNKLLKDFFFAVSKDDTTIDFKNEWDFDEGITDKVINIYKFNSMQLTDQKKVIGTIFGRKGYIVNVIENINGYDVDIILYKNNKYKLISLHDNGVDALINRKKILTSFYNEINIEELIIVEKESKINDTPINVLTQKKLEKELEKWCLTYKDIESIKIYNKTSDNIISKYDKIQVI